MNRSQILITFSSSLLAILAGTFPGQAIAAPYTLPDVPLIVSVESTPNVFMEMDDSGSMNWEILAPQHFTLCAVIPAETSKVTAEPTEVMTVLQVTPVC